MNTKKDIDKKFKNIMIILTILLIVIFIIMNVLKSNNKEELPKYNEYEIIKPMFRERFFLDYQGNIKEEDILTKLTDFTYYLIDNKKQIDNLNEFYIKNLYLKDKKYLKQIGFSSLEDYLEIISIIKKIENSELEVSYTAFSNKTMKVINGKTIVKFSIKFIDVDEINFTLEIKNDYSDDGIIKIKYYNEE